MNLRGIVKTGVDRPLTSWEKVTLALSSGGIVLLSFAFPLLAVSALLLILGLELGLCLLALRLWFLARTVVPVLAQHSRLLRIFAPRFQRHSKVADFRLTLQPSDASELFLTVARVAKRLQIAMPQEVSVEMSRNAWVRLRGYRRGRGKTILSIGYDLLAGLTRAQVDAVLAHKSSLDLKPNQVVYEPYSRCLNADFLKRARL